MPTKPIRRKALGVSAMLTLRYPAAEVPGLDAAAAAKGMTRGSYMYDVIARDVRATQKRAMREAERRQGDRRSAAA
jgi:hypothetical protein